MEAGAECLCSSRLEIAVSCHQVLWLLPGDCCRLEIAVAESWRRKRDVEENASPSGSCRGGGRLRDYRDLKF
jgi:hypothetical protein